MTSNQFKTLPSEKGMKWVSESWQIYKKDPIAFSGLTLLNILVGIGLSRFGMFGGLLGTLFGVIFGVFFIIYIKQVVSGKSPVAFGECVDKSMDRALPALLYSMITLALCGISFGVAAMCAAPFGIAAILEAVNGNGFDLPQMLLPLFIFIPVFVILIISVQAFLFLGRVSVVFGKFSPATAAVESTKATIANFSPIAIYYTVLPLIALVLVIFTLGLATIVVIPMMSIAEYLIWRDIYGEGDATSAIVETFSTNVDKPELPPL